MASIWVIEDKYRLRWKWDGGEPFTSKKEAEEVLVSCTEPQFLHRSHVAEYVRKEETDGRH